MKLHFQSLQFEDRPLPEGKLSKHPVIEHSKKTHLRLTLNSMCPGLNKHHLGFWPGPVRRQLWMMHHSGGKTGLLDLVVVKRFPMYYLGKTGYSGRTYESLLEDIEGKTQEDMQQYKEQNPTEIMDETGVKEKLREFRAKYGWDEEAGP